MRDVRVALLTSVISLGFLFVVSVSSAEVPVKNGEALLSVTFIDVGQGDATLVESPSGVQVLIDGGRDERILSALQNTLGFFDTDLDMVVATHYDADHVGGLIDVLERYEVATVLLTENAHDTPVRDAFLRAVEDEGAEVYYARSGQVYELGVGSAGTTTLRVLFPDADPTHLESNSSSIITQLTYGETEYLFTGDSPKSIEEYLVKKEGDALQSDVLKVGHHGSKTSTSETFVSVVNPTYAVISAGKNNPYGHPHEDVLKVLYDGNVLVAHTGDAGDIQMYSDGREIFVQ